MLKRSMKIDPPDKKADNPLIPINFISDGLYVFQGRLKTFIKQRTQDEST